MTYQTLVFAVAEAGTVDMKGSASAIGFLPPRLTVSQFPNPIAPTVVGIFEQEEVRAIAVGQQLEFTMQVTEENGAVAFYARQAVPLTPMEVADDPHRIQALIQVPLTVSEPTLLTFRLDISIPQVDASFFRLTALQRVRVVGE